MEPNDAKGISPELVRAVNLAYHEEEAADYDSRHPEIFTDELGHWSRIAERVRALKAELKRPVTVVDLGSGTGFVPLRLASVLDGQDEFVLTDLSPTMLDRARESLAAANFAPRVSYRVSGAESLDLAPASVDVVTMNSFIHHLPAPERAFSIVGQALRPGGIVVIAHEPNLLHFKNPIVGGLDRLIRALRKARGRKKRGMPASNPFIDRVNARLMSTGATESPLTAEKIESIVDIQSPTAGRAVDASRGFDPRAVASVSFPGYDVLDVQTYRHFGKLDVAKRPRLARLQHAMEKLWPFAGAMFLLILRKPRA